MSVKVMGEVWGLDLRTTPKLVLLALADHADDDGSSAYPSVDRIAWKCGLSRRSVQRTLRELEAAGLIVPVAYAGGGRGQATVFHLHTIKGDKLASFTSEKGRHPVPERASSATVKGAASVTPTISNHQKPIAPKFPKEQTKPMFTAFCLIFGNPVGPMRAAYGLTVNQALEAGITPDQIGPAARRYRRGWDGVACTPMALLKHWNTWGPEAAARAARDQMPPEARAAYERVSG